jgi:diguanylate cyclase (GGDEF)-like protein/PAS domain S-box-containing protein
LASAGNAIFITDEVGQIVWVNDAFSRLSGYAPEDTIGRTPAILNSGRQPDSFYSKMWQTVTSGQVWKGEIEDQKKDGSTYIVDEVITPLFDSEGTITNFIAIQHDITQRKRETEREHHLAYHDILTGLPNRGLFVEVQTKAISHARRTHHVLATLFLDLDGFKPVNDTYGHRMGDQLLIAVGERLRAAVRQEDTIARFGGDEFAILIPSLNEASVVAALAQKLIDAISRPFVLRAQKINVKASIGISLYPSDGDDAETLLVNADKAMYRAKFRGGNVYEFYTSSVPEDGEHSGNAGPGEYVGAAASTD